MKNRGFTLIEIVIYIALFSIMMGGLIATVFQLIQNSEKLSENDTVQEEMNFVLKKIDWALLSASEIKSPTSGTSKTLSINQTNFPNNPIVFDLNTASPNYHYVEFCTNSTNCNPLTTQNVTVTDISFECLTASSSPCIPSEPGGMSPPPAGIKLTITINGITISTTKYLNK